MRTVSGSIGSDTGIDPSQIVLVLTPRLATFQAPITQSLAGGWRRIDRMDSWPCRSIRRRPHFRRNITENEPDNSATLHVIARRSAGCGILCCEIASWGADFSSFLGESANPAILQPVAAQSLPSCPMDCCEWVWRFVWRAKAQKMADSRKWCQQVKMFAGSKIDVKSTTYDQGAIHPFILRFKKSLSLLRQTTPLRPRFSPSESVYRSRETEMRCG